MLEPPRLSVSNTPGAVVLDKELNIDSIFLPISALKACGDDNPASATAIAMTEVLIWDVDNIFNFLEFGLIQFSGVRIGRSFAVIC